MKNEYNKVMEEIVKVVVYTNGEDKEPLSWPSLIGNNGATFGLRVKVSYPFWQYFKAEGRKVLLDFNKKNGTRIRFLQEKCLKIKDRENLCLFIRDAIRKRYQSKGKMPIPMQLRKDHLKLGEMGTYDPVILVERLNIDLSQWKGLSMEKLMDDRIREERKAGRVVVGPLALPGLDDIQESEESCAMKRTHDSEDGGAPVNKKPFVKN
ncbi:unnamed protein product [Nippostrongylus brasiliensis]|uniref:PC4 domain-containing protein n=1 Tax=Nippostrongylus brasiliensis TaxID=27835 RepID=A0A0N4YHC8_NIPBR|nr:unnamed protein product [Nippostrongylus brasiliensis]